MLPDSAVLNARAVALLICAIGASEYHALTSVASYGNGSTSPASIHAVRDRASCTTALLLKLWRIAMSLYLNLI